MLIFAMLATFSCKDDDGEGTHHNFKNQDASGKIANVSWSYQDGYASIYDVGDSKRIEVRLVLAQTMTGCDISSFAEGDQVFFDLPTVVGVYKLVLDWTPTVNSNTATLLDTEEAEWYIATIGAIEILSISDTEVSGRIDAKADDKNFVNGNFTVSICQ